jgi:hypothetical protein
VLDWLAADLVEHKYDLKRTIEIMLTSRAYQMPAVAAVESTAKEFVFRGPQVRRLSAEQFLDAIGTITGVWNGDAVPEISFVGAGEVKQELSAKWIWSTTNAAARAEAKTVTFKKSFELPEEATEARVVMTCDNAFKLKVNGKEAGGSKDFTRPKAIDIRKFLKRGKNELVVEATNDPGSPGKTDADQSNPAGLFGHVRLRTKGQVLDFGTDASWTSESEQAAVELGESNMGPWSLGQKLARLVANQEYAANCRAVLANADPLMIALGRPNREQVITTRASAATTLQALELTNGKTLATRMKEGAENLALEKDTRKMVERLYLSALGRKPTSQESAVANEVVSGEGVEDLLWAVCMLPEFQLIR